MHRKNKELTLMEDTHKKMVEPLRSGYPLPPPNLSGSYLLRPFLSLIKNLLSVSLGLPPSLSGLTTKRHLFFCVSPFIYSMHLSQRSD